jgi:predicted nuclease of predicted toxin-antitoxin system
MNFLADESCAGPVVRTLREAGHDVVAIAEVAAGATDEQVLERALNEKRVLITEDRDFRRIGICARPVVDRSGSGQV